MARPSVPPKPSTLTGLRVPQEVMEDPKLKAAMEPLFQWCLTLGAYVAKLGDSLQEAFEADIERDEEIDNAIGSGGDAVFASQVFRKEDPPQPPEVDAQRLLAGKVFGRQPAQAPDPAADAQRMLASDSMSKHILAQPELPQDSQKLLAAQVFGRR